MKICTNKDINRWFVIDNRNRIDKKTRSTLDENMLSQTRNNKKKQRWESATKKWKRDRVRGDRVTKKTVNDGWVGEVREWIKEDRVTEEQIIR